MKYGGTLLVVEDIEKTMKFYVDVLEQVVTFDTGTDHPEGIRNVAFESGVSLQAGYNKLLDLDLKITHESNSFQIYYEVEDIEYWEKKLQLAGVTFLHNKVVYPWGQTVMRIYDVDRNIVEIAESMVSVAKRFLSQGLSVEEVSNITMFPVEMIKQLQ